MAKISSSPYFSAMIIAAFIFGISHISKGVDYAFLAFLAGILYGYPFVKYKNLFGPIMLHAFVDVIAVAYFAAPL
jgi:membrane protease YdiL (CAAX protease family)